MAKREPGARSVGGQAFASMVGNVIIADCVEVLLCVSMDDAAIDAESVELHICVSMTRNGINAMNVRILFAKCPHVI